MERKPHYYSNPAFCQKSEFVNGRPPRTLSPQGSIRQSPVGAQTTPRIHDSSITDHQTYSEEDGLQEQEFYEEVVVDDQGFITDKKFVVVAQNNEGKKYIQVPHSEERYGNRYGAPPADERRGGRYGFPQSEDNRINGRYGVPQPARPREIKLSRSQSQRYEYIQMKEHDSRMITPKSSPQKTYFHEDVEVTPGRVHRYAVIDAEEETELTSKNARYALVPVDHLNNIVPQVQTKNRYEYISETPPQRVLSEIQRTTLQKSPSRYEYIQTSPHKTPIKTDYKQSTITQSPRVGNPIATQKLHELLSTPRKSPNVQKVLSPQAIRKTVHSSLSPLQQKTPPQTKGPAPKAQQKLNYAIGTRQLAQQDKRYTAVVTPICSSPVQSVYSETTYSNKSESWMNLSVRKDSIQITLAFAAVVMLLCGGATAGLCFYMNSRGRHYFLDFGIVAGFTCLILGALGFRTRNIYWLPNRNYISGYLLLTVFSLLTCAGLLVLLLVQPRAGTPLADMTSGGVCAISVLTLLLAMAGVVSSYCCKYPPPDNRVQHCAKGFSV